LILCVVGIVVFLLHIGGGIILVMKHGRPS
jgi:hypothetical protein